MNNFAKVKGYLIDLEYNIISEDANEELFVIEKADTGIFNRVGICQYALVKVFQPIRYENE